MAKKIVYDFLTKETVVKDITSEEQKALDAIIPDAEIELANLRSARNSLLAGTDYMTLSDMPTMSDAWKRNKLSRYVCFYRHCDWCRYGTATYYNCNK